MVTRKTIEKPAGGPVTIDQSPDDNRTQLEALFPPSLGHDDETADESLISVLEQLGESESGATVNVYRTVKGESDAYLCRYSPDDFSKNGFDDLLSKYGGGTYRIRVYGSNKRLMANKAITLEAPKTPAIPVVNPSEGIDKLANAMLEGFNKLGQLIIQQSQPKNDMGEMLQNMVLMKQIVGDGAKQPQQDQLDLFLKGIEFAKMNVPEVAKEPSGNEMLMEAASKFLPVIAAGMQQPQIPQPQMPQQIQQPTQPQQIQPEIQQGNNDMNVQQAMARARMKAAVNFLVVQAQQDSDPYPYAVMAVDNVPPEDLNTIISDENYIEFLAQFDNEVKQYPDWFNELREGIKQVLTEQTEPATTGANSPSGANGPGPDNATS